MKVYGDRARRLVMAGVCAGLACGLSGCMHKRPKVPVLPAVLAPVQTVTPPAPAKLPLLQAPEVELPPTPIAEAAASPRRERRRSVPKTVVTPAPAEETPETQPVTDEAAIGQLTAGGTADPQAQQEARDLIASIEKRLNALPAQTVKKQRSQISKVRNFWLQAQAAFNSGDAEGAKTLATKAKLLLDDLEKQGGGVD